MRSITGGLVALLLAAAIPAQAAIISLSDISAGWANARPAAGPGTGIDIDNLGSPVTVRWGDGGEALQSGYDFTAAAGTPSFSVPPSPSAARAIGSFSHLNFPVGPPVLTSVQLTISAVVSVDGVTQGSRSFTFDFVHDETDNALKPCPFGAAADNADGCADLVTVSIADATETFSVGADLYTLEILGFSQDGGASIAGSFITREGTINTADLFARVSLRSAQAVPEPGTLALLAAALLGLSAARRRAARGQTSASLTRLPG